MSNKLWYRLQLPNPHFLYILCTAQQPKSDLGRLVVEISRLHKITHTTIGINPLNECSVRRRSRYLHSTKQAQETKIHALSGNWTSGPSNRASKYPLFRQHGHGDRPIYFTMLNDYGTYFRLQLTIVRRELKFSNLLNFKLQSNSHCLCTENTDEKNN
jgi:hypothetical protein